MGELTLYFDRCCGKQFPKQVERLKPPFRVRSHYGEGFRSDLADDEWLTIVGPHKWLVVSHDCRFHLDQLAMKAIAQFRIGCFYMWGAQVPDWDKIGFLATQFPKMKALSASQRKPFIYHVQSTGGIKLVKAWNDQSATASTSERAAE